MKQLLSVAAVSLVGCAAFFGHGPRVPDDYQGTTQITVANAADKPLCAFMLWAGDSSAADNWLGDKSKKEDLQPGATRTFSIRPGVYHIVGGFCDGETLLAAMGTYGPATKSIQGPTTIAFGQNQVAAVAGSHTLRFTQVFAAGGGGGGGGEEPAAEEAPAEEASSSSSSSSSSSPAAAEKPAARCQGSGGTCGFENDAPCCAGTTCTSVDQNGHGTCR